MVVTDTRTSCSGTISVGVLGLQGGVKEHLAMLDRLENVEGKLILRSEDLDGLDALILPGGESTAIGKLLHDLRLFEPLRVRIESGLPVWGTCAGMILLARDIENDHRHHLALMDISVNRNGWGRQLHSFIASHPVINLEGAAFPMVFIRAPRISRVGRGVTVLASIDGEPVACRQANLVATSFHPELTDDGRFHAWFAELARAAKRGH